MHAYIALRRHRAAPSIGPLGAEGEYLAEAPDRTGRWLLRSSFSSLGDGAGNEGLEDGYASRVRAPDGLVTRLRFDAGFGASSLVEVTQDPLRR
jgi:hypothetical protein